MTRYRTAVECLTEPRDWSLKHLAAASLLWLLSVIAAGPASSQEFTVGPSELKDYKAVFGFVTSSERAQARSRLSGTLTALNVDEGDTVSANQQIAEIVDPKLKPRLAAIDAGIKALIADRELAKTEQERMERLYRTGAVSTARLDEARTRVSVVEANISARRAERLLVEEQVREGRVLAPTSGRVLEVPVTMGSFVMAGEPVAIIATSDYVIRLELPERHARHLKEGDTVLIGRSLLSDTVSDLREGRIGKVYPELKDGRVIADLVADSLGDYFVGERVPVRIVTGARSGFLIPAAYLFLDHGVAFVSLKDAGRTVVQPGPEHTSATGEAMVEIHSGLRNGDVLVRPERGN